jgi:hypothetical protein
MARMYPPVVVPDTKSEGERELFRRLRDDPAAADWIVLHSLNIADHPSQLAGEVDFVIIVPHKGVLFLEVKGAHEIRRVDGGWYYGSDPKLDPRGPFRQASSAMHSLRDKLFAAVPSVHRVPYWSAAVFPYAKFEIQSPEWHSWQAIGSEQFRRYPISRLVLGVLDNARRFLQTKPSAKWFDPQAGEPDPHQCKLIQNFLRQDFEVFESPVRLAQYNRQQLLRYTQEQFDALDSMVANPRVMFCGPAGTGKTVLAIEAARRSHASGARVLLICFNKLLGEALAAQTAALHPDFTAATLHAHMRRVAGIDIPNQVSKDFWENELPELAINKLLEDLSGQYVYDELIVDETQDLLREPYLDFLDLSLRGGLAAGRCRFFGDLDRQSIYADEQEDLLASRRRLPGITFDLRINCRNTPRIANYVELLGQLKPPYSRVRRPDNGLVPRILPYVDTNHQRDLLAAELGRFRKSVAQPEDIIILSSRSDETCAAAGLPEPWAQRVAPLRGLSAAGKTPFCTIHAYKGLDATAVIVTDIESAGTPAAADLLYIALTRACDQLCLLVSKSAAEILTNIVIAAPVGGTNHG